MNSSLVSQCILSGILAGNETLFHWTGGEWVCDRGNIEYVLSFAVAEKCRASMRGWRVWPEMQAHADFDYIFRRVGKKYHELNLPAQVFGGAVRYDLGLLPSSNTISALIEIKRYWTTEDLPRLAQSLLYLGREPDALTGGEGGVSLESVFFGCFIWTNPNAKDPTQKLSLEKQYSNIQAETEAWWQRATTPSAAPLQEQFKNKYNGYCPKPQYYFNTQTGTGEGEKADYKAGAVCVCLSLNEDP